MEIGIFRGMEMTSSLGSTKKRFRSNLELFCQPSTSLFSIISIRNRPIAKKNRTIVKKLLFWDLFGCTGLFWDSISFLSSSKDPCESYGLNILVIR